MSSVIIIYHPCCVVSVCLQSHYNLLWYGNKPLWALSDLCFVSSVSMSDLMSSSPNSTDFLCLWGIMAFTMIPVNIADRGELTDAPLDTASGETGTHKCHQGYRLAAVVVVKPHHWGLEPGLVWHCDAEQVQPLRFDVGMKEPLHPVFDFSPFLIFSPDWATVGKP